MTTVSIHQPGYLPWLGFFKKIMESDVFVFLDDVKYEKKQWHNRNKIRTSQGSMWLSVPVKSNSGDSLNEVTIDNSINWSKYHKKSIKLNNSKCSFFKEYFFPLEKILDKKYDLLIDLNIEVIQYIIKCLELNTQTTFSSELKIEKKGSDRILDICKKLNADIYLSGALGTDYLNLDDFTKNDITVLFQNFHQPVYKQCFEPFIPNMTTIDLLFNEGKKSIQILKEAKNF